MGLTWNKYCHTGPQEHRPQTGPDIHAYALCRRIRDRAEGRLSRPVRQVTLWYGPSVLTVHGPTLGRAHNFVCVFLGTVFCLFGFAVVTCLLCCMCRPRERERESIAGTRWCSFNPCTVPTPVVDGIDPECGSRFHGRVTAIKRRPITKQEMRAPLQKPKENKQTKQAGCACMPICRALPNLC